MNHTIIPATGWTAPTSLEAAGSFAVLGAVLVGCLWLAHRHRDGVMTRAIGTVIVAIVTGFATVGRIPITAFGLEAHVFWWLWPLSTFVFFVVVGTFVRALARGRRAVVRHRGCLRARRRRVLGARVAHHGAVAHAERSRGCDPDGSGHR